MKPDPAEAALAYRILTGPDAAAFCQRVREAPASGCQLQGSPAATFNGRQVIVAQALIRPSAPAPRPKAARGRPGGSRRRERGRR